MNIGNLQFNPIIENQNLVPSCIYNFVSKWNDESEKSKFLVAEINPEFADGNKLCDEYNIDKKMGFNCLIVECKRNETIKYCALIVPIGYKYNMGSVEQRDGPFIHLTKNVTPNWYDVFSLWSDCRSYLQLFSLLTIDTNINQFIKVYHIFYEIQYIFRKSFNFI